MQIEYVPITLIPVGAPMAGLPQQVLSLDIDSGCAILTGANSTIRIPIDGWPGSIPVEELMRYELKIAVAIRPPSDQ